MQPIIYSVLRAEMQKQLVEALPGNFKQSFSNLNTALSQFLRELAIPGDAVVGTEFKASYYKLTARHLANLQAAGRSDQSIRDRKSLLKKWRMLFVKLDGEQSAFQPSQSPFVNALTDALPQGASLRAIAQQASVPYGSLMNWRSGKLPAARSLPALRRLERFLSLTSGYLTDFVAPPSRAATDASSPYPVNPYRERLKTQRAAPYRLTSISEILKAEWTEFLDYKTADLLINLVRSDKGRWSDSPLHPGVAKMEQQWFAFTDEGLFIPSAALNWGFVTAFLGWVSQHGGRPEEALTFALFTDISLLNRYLVWCRKQAGGKFNSGHTRFVVFVLSLVHPRTGYLTQKPELRLNLTDGVSEESWNERCSAAFARLTEHKKSITKAETLSRDPDTPVAAILALENPMLALHDMRNRIRASRPTAGTLTEALWGRDLLLIGLMMCSPLRAKNLKHLSYRADGTGNLRRKPDGTWQLVIEREHFKNRDGAASKRKYCIDLDPTLYRDIQAYLQVFRPMLLRRTVPESDYVFVSGRPGTENIPWDRLNRRVEALTAKFLMQCAGVGPQALRHIVATAIVKATGEFNTAALVLHDEEETVKKTYAHLIPEDGHVRYRKLFPGVFDGAD